MEQEAFIIFWQRRRRVRGQGSRAVCAAGQRREGGSKRSERTHVRRRSWCQRAAAAGFLNTGAWNNVQTE